MTAAFVAIPLVTTFEDLVDRHQREVLAVCRSILRDEHLGADAAQETFARLWRRLAEGREPERSSAWLRRVAVSTSIDLARTRERSAEGAEVEEALADPRTGTGAAVAGEAELAARYEAALAELSDGQRAVFLLRHEGDLALSEVAETLGVSLPTVKTQFARACLKLQEKLATFRPEGRRDGR